MKAKSKTLSTPLFGDVQTCYAPPAEHVIDLAFEHYRSHGFPYPTCDDIRSEFQGLCERDTHNIIDRVNVAADNTGVQIANSFMRHRYEVECNNNRTAMQVFKDDKLFRKCLEKCYYMQGGITHSKLRSMLAIFEGAQIAANFPPATAKAIYETYTRDGAFVYDMSAGWGGRMLGAMASRNVAEYIATEPSTRTIEALKRMRSELELYTNCNVTLLHHGSEVRFASEATFDLCFTSPPYFNTEKYSDEETQSYVAYPTHSAWLHRFLVRTLENCFYYLKPQCFCIVNIANTSKMDFVEHAIVREATAIGFEHVETKSLRLSSMPGKGGTHRGNGSVSEQTKGEPIFFFKRP